MKKMQAEIAAKKDDEEAKKEAMEREAQMRIDAEMRLKEQQI